MIPAQSSRIQSYWVAVGGTGSADSTGRRATMLTIVFLILLGALAIAGIAIAFAAGSRRRKGQHHVPFESADAPKTGRASGLD
jgi:hypothetical protein